MSTLKFLLLTALLFSSVHGQIFEPKHKLAPNVQSHTPQIDREKFDVHYYRLEMQIDFEHKQISGKTTIRLSSLQNNLKTITLDFNSPMSVDSIGGDAVDFIKERDFLRLKLKKPHSKNQHIEVWIAYSGNPQVQGSVAFNFSRMTNQEPYVWTLSEPFGARQWWPCKDTPADKADSIDLFITVPEGNIVGSNGLLESVQQTTPGWQTFHWHESYPIATYLVSIVAGPYAHFSDYYHYNTNDSMLLDYYVFPDQLNEAKVIFKEMHDYLKALSHFFGPYPFLKEKYGQAQFGWGGGMEHQTLTSIGKITPAWQFLYVHELGHQWFGDQVTCASWHDIWLNEGFASYSEALYAQWAGFKGQPAGLKAYLEYMNSQQFFDDGTIFIEDTTKFENIFGRIVYHKGSWVLHMLRKVMGDDYFFEALKQYLTDPRWTYGSVRTENFKEICERVSGQDLEAFFNQWLYYPFYPKYEYEWEIKNESGNYLLHLAIRQIQMQTLYIMPIELRIVFKDLSDTLITVNNDQFTQEYQFSFNKEPIQVIFDPNNWILDQHNEISPNPLVQGMGFHRVFPNPSSSKVHIEMVYWQQKDFPIEIFDLNGRKIKTLYPYNRLLNLRQYLWDGKNETGRKVASGVYFLKAPNEVSSNVQKVILLR